MWTGRCFRKVVLVTCVEDGLVRVGLMPGDREAGKGPQGGCPCGAPRASQLPVRPKFHPKRTLGFLPPPPTQPFPAGCQSGGPSPPHPQPLSQLSCDKQGRRLQLAGDNVRINDKICKAWSAALGREKKCHGCVIFPKSGFCVSFFSFPIREAVLTPGAERSWS